MASFSTRRLRTACILGAIAVAAFAAPGVASAKTLARCSGIQSFTGAGSTLQKLANVTVWGPQFNVAANSASCTGAGTEPKLTYKSIGSVQGMEEWGLNGHKFEVTTSFVTTDEPPNATQKGTLEAAGSKLETVPVLQGAVAMLVHLPTGCKAEDNEGDGRLDLGNKTIEATWAGQLKTWKALVETKESVEAGDTITPATCLTETIKHIVRKDGSGTTHIFKKYLAVINGSRTFEVEEPKSGTKTAGQNWTTIDEGTLNQSWPVETAVTQETGEGGGALVETVEEDPSSIGYANVADARAKTKKVGLVTYTFAPRAGDTGGKGTEVFWAPVENKAAAGAKVATYADPSTDLEASEKPTQANCLETEYTNGTKAFPPKKTGDAWNEVTTSLTEKNYTLCGLTYDLGYDKYGSTAFGAAGLATATTVKDYLEFVLSTGVGGGQERIGNNQDYLPLTAKLDTEALAGAGKIKK
ncbi:MAG TPA: substrate-binding domain-containing protein [Solirubrobacteraceae bacterium]|nr:substrate-binding domain-containing protein [Solirubrobacteraceae bacterium]